MREPMTPEDRATQEATGQDTRGLSATSAGPMNPLDILVLVLSGVPISDLKPEARP